MARVNQHTPGAFCWVDLATYDAKKAQEFYRGLFGWRIEPAPMPGGDGEYLILYKGDAMVGGLYEMTGETKAMGIPPHWVSYIATDDVDVSLAKVRELGGAVDGPVQDVPGVGRVAAVRDPEGASFQLYTPGGEAGMQVAGEPGAYCWSELYSKNPTVAVKFYEKLFGWVSEQSTSADGSSPYYGFSRDDGVAAAGILQIRPEWGEMSPSWAVYFAVEDLDQSLERAQSLGGKQEMPPTTVEGVGRFSLLVDPTGAFFLVMQLAPRRA